VHKSKNISQEELAYTSELELIQIGRIERGTINISISNVAKIAEATGIHPKELFDF
jgi:transcriptional regulator with XRE-family HTH domain